MTSTDRLLLTAPTGVDLDELHVLHADAGVWAHMPSGRHTTVARTEALLTRAQQGWEQYGLDLWVVRRHSAEEGRAPLVGMAGCSVRHDAVWNLYYRLAPDVWGRGYAQEVIAAAREAAGWVRPELPVTAYLLEHNEGSRRAAERAGLRLLWRGPDAGNPDPDAVRLVYADRELDAATLALIADRS